mmetsp:Transcript_13309/g.18181  ORF Transcript_13309/g.18181 Transcript_13309/m.18181 type:complete len:345 (-) Transcript_13309:65-1099(-)|eukprot:CAMPEP_0196590124 /NCGR_PEP_ID=MMETSP1081-20130531/65654_1 /TAXON_ID=36882 /ORGANISM="Pyramimonas amylifera, Strain CCMP720" /LENGTH=344 /DNA_ID=CAMNT_0041913127 /DNA_START=129 /DNA_END=1163 /DNA_ORIENTATION=-
MTVSGSMCASTQLRRLAVDHPRRPFSITQASRCTNPTHNTNQTPSAHLTAHSLNQHNRRTHRQRKIQCEATSPDNSAGVNGSSSEKRGEKLGDKLDDAKKEKKGDKKAKPGEYGPQLPPSMGGPKEMKNIPNWQRLLEEEALKDEEVAELLEGCEGDPQQIYEKIRKRFNSRSADIISERERREAGMQVTFRDFDSFNLWVWIELYDYPMETERKLLEETIDAWFTLGHLGGFNCLNLQVSEQGEGVSYMEYDNKQALEDISLSLFHNMDEVQFQGNWARFWCDLGTADELSMDVLINVLTQLSREYVGIKQLVVGGINSDWKEGTEAKRGGDLFFRMGKPLGL